MVNYPNQTFHGQAKPKWLISTVFIISSFTSDRQLGKGGTQPKFSNTKKCFYHHAVDLCHCFYICKKQIFSLLSLQKHFHTLPCTPSDLDSIDLELSSFTVTFDFLAGLPGNSASINCCTCSSLVRLRFNFTGRSNFKLNPATM